ncbi:MAG TPA: glycosyltransferase family 2 protein [Tepidisphaeraceae bacterium]|jgi:dolichol-phosphate mannosyltransferase
MQPRALSVVVPCFNESESLHETYRRLTAACVATGWPYELLLVDDGSTDATWPLMKDLAGTDPHVRSIKLSRNHGHQLALSAGLTQATGDRILIIDADLQDPPELMSEMMKLMDDGADVVYGQRATRDGETWFKVRTASAFYALVNRLSEVKIPRETGDFRMISRRVLNVLLEMPERHRFIRGMIAWIGFKQVPLRYERRARFAGQTKYPLKKMMRFAADAVTGFSIKPLQFASVVGLAFAGLGLILVGFSVVSWLFFRAVPGWASTLAAVSVIGSVQLFMLGIIGEYLGRLYEQSKGRPLFTIDVIVGSGPESRPHP